MMEGNPFRALKERLGHGAKWIKGTSWDGKGNACLAGGLADVCQQQSGTFLSQTFLPLRDELITVVQEQYPDRVPHFRIASGETIPCFNDNPATTWEDVELVLEKAAVKWDETH